MKREDEGGATMLVFKIVIAISLSVKVIAIRSLNQAFVAAPKYECQS